MLQYSIRLTPAVVSVVDTLLYGFVGAGCGGEGNAAF